MYIVLSPVVFLGEEKPIKTPIKFAIPKKLVLLTRNILKCSSKTNKKKHYIVVSLSNPWLVGQGKTYLGNHSNPGS